ncbi:MAG TPA: nucleotide exchange factor GrpE [Actinomycetota bacterium]|jgi:molecular chaperone GrpE|nr:nucleotide exchange factor GrpE [Actinomycetota bacterium]
MSERNEAGRNDLGSPEVQSGPVQPGSSPSAEEQAKHEAGAPGVAGAAGAGEPVAAEPVEAEIVEEEPQRGPVAAAEEQVDYKDLYVRAQADMANFRKRMMREANDAERRGKGRLIERLLPILDNFEAAISHGEGGPGVELVYKELRSTLDAEGLKEIEAQDVSFDPAVHDAVESVEKEGIDDTVVTKVYRRGYMLGDRVLRPAMVVVARPAESAPEASSNAGSEE